MSAWKQWQRRMPQELREVLDSPRTSEEDAIQAPLHLRHRVHHARILFNVAVIAHRDSWFAHTTDVVARQVNEHVEFRFFLFGVQQAHHVMVIGQAICAARHGARNGPLLDDAVFDAHEHFWRGPDQRFITVIDVELVR